MAARESHYCTVGYRIAARESQYGRVGSTTTARDSHYCRVGSRMAARDSHYCRETHDERHTLQLLLGAVALDLFSHHPLGKEEGEGGGGRRW